jgi:hypothetical protein
VLVCGRLAAHSVLTLIDRRVANNSSCVQAYTRPPEMRFEASQLHLGCVHGLCMHMYGIASIHGSMAAATHHTSLLLPLEVVFMA